MKSSNANYTLTLSTIVLALAGCPSDDVSEAQDTSGETEAATTGSSNETTSLTTNVTTNATTSSTSDDPDGSDTQLDTTGGTAEPTTETSTEGTTTGATSSTGSEGTETGITGTTMEVGVCGDGVVSGGEECDDGNQDPTDGCLPTCQLARSCAQILQEVPNADDGTYAIDPDDGGSFAVSCDMTTDGGGWTLAARYSNADNIDHWMLNDGGWWFDLEVEQGNPLSTAQLSDMLSQSFWRVPAQEFKVARSDNADPSHLLMTIDDCLGGDTFRDFITSLGFENVGLPWSTDEVLHTCAVSFGNNYATTDGFTQAHCTGDIGGPESISFWANWHDPNNAFAADSAVMMIGGGGQACARADHGIGITEENEGSFTVFDQPEGTFESDFGNDGFAAPTFDYALNLYVR